MKKRIIFSILFLFPSLCFSKVWFVDLNTANHPDYTNLQTAIDSAQIQDTLYVAGHPASYGNIIVKKEIILIGQGYFLLENPATQAYPFTAKIGQIEFQNGGNNAIVCGFELSNLVIGCNNVVIKRNYIHSANSNLIQVLNNIINITIEQNYLSHEGQGWWQDFCAILINNADNVIIRNNYIYAYLYWNFYGIKVTGGTTTIYNNIINAPLSLPNGDFYNNILVCSDIAQTTDGCLLRNNISTGTRVGTSNGNQSNVDMSTVFVATESSDGRWQLKSGSLASNAGLYGDDCGMFGGADPYVLSGIPSIPTIYDAIIPSNASEQEGLKIIIKTKTNR